MSARQVIPVGAGQGGREESGAAPTRTSVLAQASDLLERSGVPSPGHDAEALLLHALATSRSELWSNRNASVSEEESARLGRLLEARSRRVPLQHLLGEISFLGAELDIEPGVFVPRPETEGLVAHVLQELGAELAESPARGSILDLGTGTGAIPIAMLLALPEGWTATAIDRCDKAIALAARNARRNGVQDRLRLTQADFRDPSLAVDFSPVDVLVSNLPYIPSSSIPSLMPEVRDHDPLEALDGGPDGLDAFRAAAVGLPAWLKPGGLLALEIGGDQADRCMELFGPHLAGPRVESDLAGTPRVLIGRMRGPRR